MELTINIKMDERFAAAVEMLAAAIGAYAKAYEKANEYMNDYEDAGSHPGEPKTVEAAVVEEQAPVDVVEDPAPVAAHVGTLTRAELQAKAARLMQIERGKYAIDLKGALEQCGAANISSLEESMFEKFNSLMADLWEVAA